MDEASRRSMRLLARPRRLEAMHTGDVQDATGRARSPATGDPGEVQAEQVRLCGADRATEDTANTFGLINNKHVRPDPLLTFYSRPHPPPS